MPKSGASTHAELGILSDIQILQRLVADDDSCIFVSPLIKAEAQLGPSSLDLHLGSDLRSTTITDTTHIDLTEGKDAAQRQVSAYYVDRKDLGEDEGLVLHPGEFALASTVEFIRLPKDIARRLEGRSSFGRLGLQIHATAGFVDPGFEGSLTFELINAGNLPLKLKAGLRLAQLCFFPISEVQVPYMAKPGSKYGGKMGVQGSKIHEDPEI